MPYDATYPSVPPVPRSGWRVFMWALFFFTMINVGVWLVFDYQFFERIGFERLLNEPSENQLRDMIAAVRADTSFRHVVLVGDSTVWGVPLPYEQTIARRIVDAFRDEPDVRVVNLAAPGASFADQYAIIDHLSSPEDTYLFFVNPLWFQDRYNALPYAKLVRFPSIVAESLFGDREELSACCDLQIPSPRTPEAIVRRALHRFLPLYHNRDTINALLFRMHPALAERAVLARLGRSNGSVDDIRNTANPNGKGALPAPDFAQARNTALLRYVRSRIGDRPNVHFIVLDDDQFFRSAQHAANIQLLLTILGQTNVLNLQDTIDHSLFSGTTHLLPEAQEHVAQAILQHLHAP